MSNRIIIKTLRAGSEMLENHPHYIRYVVILHNVNFPAYLHF